MADGPLANLPSIDVGVKTKACSVVVECEQHFGNSTNLEVALLLWPSEDVNERVNFGQLSRLPMNAIVYARCLNELHTRFVYVSCMNQDTSVSTQKWIHLLNAATATNRGTWVGNTSENLNTQHLNTSLRVLARRTYSAMFWLLVQNMNNCHTRKEHADLDEESEAVKIGMFFIDQIDLLYLVHNNMMQSYVVTPIHSCRFARPVTVFSVRVSTALLMYGSTAHQLSCNRRTQMCKRQARVLNTCGPDALLLAVRTQSTPDVIHSVTKDGDAAWRPTACDDHRTPNPNHQVHAHTTVVPIGLGGPSVDPPREVFRYAATRFKHNDGIQSLIEDEYDNEYPDCDVYTHCNTGFTLLHAAVTKDGDNLAVVRYLVDVLKVEFDILDERGMTPLQLIQSAKPRSFSTKIAYLQKLTVQKRLFSFFTASKKAYDVQFEAHELSLKEQ
jgi:hypothetical protein